MAKRFRIIGVLTILLQWLLSSAALGLDPDFGTKAEAIKPAVVMIKTNYHAQVSLPAPYITAQNKANIKSNALHMILRGQIPPSQSAALSAAASMVINNPLTYMSTSNKMETINVNFTTTGTGLVINEQGCIVTTLDLVQPDDQILNERVLNQASIDFTNKLLSKYSGIIPGGLKADTAFRTYVDKYIKVTSLKPEITVLTGPVDSQSAGMKASLLSAKSPLNNLAIIKLENTAALPSLAIGPATFQPDDQVGILAYPLIAPGKDKVEPTFIKGIYSELSAADEWNGAPVFNKTGDILGIIQFTKQTDQNNTAKFSVIPAEQISQLAQSLEVQTQENNITKLYKEALNQYAVSHYRKALKPFNEVSQIAPGHPYVAYYISSSASEIAAGHDKSYDSLIRIFLISFALAAALVVCLRYLKIRRGKAFPEPPTPLS